MSDLWSNIVSNKKSNQPALSFIPVLAIINTFMALYMCWELSILSIPWIAGTILTHILQVSKLRHQEIKEITGGHTVC